MAFTDYTKGKFLDALLNAAAFSVATPYVSLHTADPGQTGADEVVGGSYARQLVSVGAVAGGAVDNDAIVLFEGLPAIPGGVVWVGLWDALNAGNFLARGQLAAPMVFAGGEDGKFKVGDLDFAFA